VTDLAIPELVAAQLAYHLRLAAGFAAAGEAREAASQAALAWTLLELHGGAGCVGVSDDLPGLRATGVSPEHWHRVRERTHAVALEMQAHFVSEGQHALASLYSAAGGAVPATVDGLCERR
jgi:hypothetical protein